MRKERKIPTILGLVILLGSIFSGVFLTNRTTSFNSKASSDCNPINPQITNITNNSFNVSFTTSADCLSIINVDNRTISDIRFVNTDTKETATKIHYFEINNLKDNTDYQFYFINNGSKFENQNYKTQTAQKPTNSIPTSNLAWGRVFTSDLKPASDSIVYLNTSGAAPLSAFVTSKGYWNISLATSFNDAKNNWFTPPGNQDEYFIVISKDNQTTQITGNTSNNNPVPDIIIGQNKFSQQPVTSYGTEQSGYLNSVTPVVSNKSLTIVNPKENEAVFALKPDFFGVAPPSTTVNIQMDSINIKDKTTSKSDGSWHWSPPNNLSLGENSITATAINPKTSLLETVTRKFIIVNNNNGPAFSASQSGELITPTLAPTLEPTLAAPEPTLEPTPTVVVTKAPTAVITKTKTSTDSSLLKTGGTLPTVILVSLSTLLVIASFLVL